MTAGARADRPIVVTPYALPAWAEEGLDALFDIRRIGSNRDADAQAMLASGPEAVPGDLIDRLPALRYICCLGSGVEGVDVAHARSRGIVVSNSAIVTAEDVADQMLAITLAQHCQVVSLDRAIREGCWLKPLRRPLGEIKVGILGLGMIGQAVARRFVPFGCEIRWTGPRPKDVPYAYSPTLIELAEWCDILLVAARADAGNRHLIDAGIIAAVGPEGLIANVSRGTIVDEDALIAALRSGALGGAALDVFEQEPTPSERWADVSNVVLSPHVGGYTSGVRRGISRLVQRNLSAFFAGADIKGAI